MGITELLQRAKQGDEEAGQQVFPLVYQELKRLAASHLRGQGNVTLSATALVHETFLRFVDSKALAFEDRAHFFGIASRVMRNVLVDLVRHAHAQKRGGPELTVPLDCIGDVQDQGSADVMLLDEALSKLARDHPRPATILEMKYFGGMTTLEAAGFLDLSEATVRRDIRFAEAWLRRELAVLPAGRAFHAKSHFL